MTSASLNLLFSPILVGKFTLRNRIVFLPHSAPVSLTGWWSSILPRLHQLLISNNSLCHEREAPSYLRRQSYVAGVSFLLPTLPPHGLAVDT